MKTEKKKMFLANSKRIVAGFQDLKLMYRRKFFSYVSFY